MDHLETLPLDDVSKLKPARVVEGGLLDSLEAAADEDCVGFCDVRFSCLKSELF